MVNLPRPRADGQILIMPRPLGIEYPGPIDQVMNRGIAASRLAELNPKPEGQNEFKLE
jgi:hypothetical protein